MKTKFVRRMVLGVFVGLLIALATDVASVYAMPATTAYYVTGTSDSISSCTARSGGG